MMLIRKQMLRKKLFLLTFSFFVLALVAVAIPLKANISFAQTPPPPSGCPVSPGHFDFCKLCGPCASGEGDCDNNSECLPGLTCRLVSGTDFCAG